MALSKEVKYDKIEVVGDMKAIQIFQANLKRFRIFAMQSGRMK
jgi:hypothetical protein